MIELIGAIIQARCDSKRLPNKVIMKISDKTVLEHIIQRTQYSQLIEKIVVATTTKCSDTAIVKICNDIGISCFCGSEDNVLERFYKAASQYSMDIIVRITADDPLKDPIIINKAIDLLLNNKYDYVSNTINPTYPEGIDVEVFTFKTLERAYNEAVLPSELEHVTPYIWKNPSLFSICNFENDINLSHMRWTLDTEDDLKFITKIYDVLYSQSNFFYMQNILDLIDNNPDLLSLNYGHIRNEGYLKSLDNEKNGVKI